MQLRSRAHVEIQSTKSGWTVGAKEKRQTVSRQVGIVIYRGRIDRATQIYGSRPRIAGRLLFSNWHAAGIIIAMSGMPVDITDSNSGSFYLGLNNGLSRPGWAPGATRTTATSNIPQGYFFNPFAFVRPIVLNSQVIPSSHGTATASATGTDFGNVGRNVLCGPPQTNVDF
jgi:hypothetical protein